MDPGIPHGFRGLPPAAARAVGGRGGDILGHDLAPRAPSDVHAGRFGALGVGHGSVEPDTWATPALRADQLVTDGAGFCARHGPEVTCWGVSRHPRVHLPGSREEPRRENLPPIRALVAGTGAVVAVAEDGALHLRRGSVFGPLRLTASPDARVAARLGGACVVEGAQLRCRGNLVPWRHAFDAPPDSLSVGPQHGCAVVAGQARCWGRATWGQLGPAE